MEAKTIEELLKIYDEVDSFSEGLARVCKGSQEFHIHPDGTPAYEQRFDRVGSFSGGRAWVWKGREKFYVRPDGIRVD